MTNPAAGPGKRNLVVVRAGGKSLHHGWLDEPYKTRSWDLIVSYFSDEAFAAHDPQPGVSAVLIKGGKWNGLFETLSAMPELATYAYIWLPDDDIATTGTTINAMFEEAAAQELAVCQPALTRNSYYSHFLFMQNSAFRLRYTNYVEIMVPCLRADILAQALPLFENTMSGYGLDYLWCRMAGAGRHKAAILDEIAVHHTRPVGSALRGKIAEETGGTSEDEEQELVAAHFGPIARPVPLVYAGITADGSRIDGRFATARRMLPEYWHHSHEFLDPAKARRKAIQIFKRQLIKTLTLEPLPKPRRAKAATKARPERA